VIRWRWLFEKFFPVGFFRHPRRHLESLVDELPAGALLVADAGFVGYELCRRIHASGRFFLFRVGSNITLLTELGYHYEEHRGLVYLWPQKRRDQPPLVLRLITLARGQQVVYVLTKALDSQELTDAEASLLYEMRWGIEVFYRSAKQTLERRRLLSRTPATCLAEAQWTLLGIWLLGLLTVTRLVDQDIDPLEMSYAKARNAVRRALRGATSTRRHHRRPSPGRGPERSLPTPPSQRRPKLPPQKTRTPTRTTQNPPGHLKGTNHPQTT
jgi:Transposase DDE domain